MYEGNGFSEVFGNLSKTAVFDLEFMENIPSGGNNRKCQDVVPCHHHAVKPVIWFHKAMSP